MKRNSLVLVGLSLCLGNWCFGQSQEAAQLLLNVEKLAQLKNILSDMKKGYQVVSIGYQSVKNIAQGNFSLHEVFLDGLMVVSPEVRSYARVADVLVDQRRLVSEYKRALGEFSSSGVFDEGTMGYLERVYGNLFAKSLQNLEDLTLVITSSKLRMRDDERLHTIDRIFEESRDQLLFLRQFNAEAASLLAVKRQGAQELLRLRYLVD